MYEVYKELRDKAGVTDYRVAVETGISPTVFSEWKKGLYTPKIDKILKIATYFGVPVEEFLKGQEK